MSSAHDLTNCVPSEATVEVIEPDFSGRSSESIYHELLLRDGVESEVQAPPVAVSTRVFDVTEEDAEG